MPGRKYSSTNGYRYGFNGKEKDNEDYGEGNAYDFEARIYDPRLGRWMSVDPLQQRFAGLSPYNYCYNSPLKFVDPDGKLGIVVDIMYNEKTKGYTILKITIKAEVAWNPKTSQGMMEHYSDYIQINKYTPRKDFPTPALDVDFTYSTERTTTFFRMDGYANSKANYGVYENYKGGIMWTSSDQTSGSEETRKSQPDAIVSIDGLATLLTRGAQLAGKGQEFGDLGKLNEFLDKFSELVQQNMDKKPSDAISNPEQVKLFNELKKLLPNITPENSNSSGANYPKPGIKPGDVVNFGPNNSEKGNDLTWKSSTKPATDTSPVWKGYKGKPVGTTPKNNP